MNTRISELSVFVPAFNEEGNLKKTVLRTKEILTKVSTKWELIIVNDGSTDKTKEVATKLSHEDKRIRLINHEVNKGYGAALKEGFYAAKYAWISFIDSDGQFDFAEISNFLEKQQETDADLVIGYYKKRQVSKFTILSSKIWEMSVFVTFGLKVRDIDCGFKLISKQVIDSIQKLESNRGAFISSELLIKARKKGFKIAEVPVTHYPRSSGKATGRKLKVIIQSYIDLGRLWVKLNLG